MRLLRAMLASRKGQVLVALAMAWAAWEAWLTIHAPAKVAGPFPGTGENVNVLVTLPFPPERFHIQAFQRHGRVSGTNETTVEVRGVKRSDLQAVARPYWVSRVEPLQEGG
ncbi:MAG: hypothetical protein NW223_02220 [Hyphomicrobiaceae bacterium]|nr:hypothetical protein [Hyphomicrobiaceae bacterium]